MSVRVRARMQEPKEEQGGVHLGSASKAVTDVQYEPLVK